MKRKLQNLLTQSIITHPNGPKANVGIIEIAKTVENNVAECVICKI